MKYSKEAREKISRSRLERKAKFGYLNSPETRRKISEILKRQFQEGRIVWNKDKHIQTNTGRTHFKKGQPSIFRGRRHTQEANQKNREKHLGKIAWNKDLTKEDPRVLKYVLGGQKTQFKKGNIPHNKGKSPTLEVRSKIRAKRMEQVFPVKDSYPEILIQNELKNRNIKFEAHRPLLGIAQPDIFIEPNICVFCDGDWWHVNPKYIWKKLFPKQIKTAERDKIQNEKLEENSYIVIRFWESDIKQNVKKCVDEIEKITESL